MKLDYGMLQTDGMNNSSLTVYHMHIYMQHANRLFYQNNYKNDIVWKSIQKSIIKENKMFCGSHLGFSHRTPVD